MFSIQSGGFFSHETKIFFTREIDNFSSNFTKMSRWKLQGQTIFFFHLSGLLLFLSLKFDDSSFFFKNMRPSQ